MLFRIRSPKGLLMISVMVHSVWQYWVLLD